MSEFDNFKNEVRRQLSKESADALIDIAKGNAPAGRSRRGKKGSVEGRGDNESFNKNSK